MKNKIDILREARTEYLFDQSLNEDFDLQEKGLYIPDGSKSLNIPRGKMPQINSKDHNDFIKFARQNGYDVDQKKVSPKVYKPSQRNFNQEKIVGLMGKDLDKPIFVSGDGYIIDGHHRWLAAWNNGNQILATIIDASVKEIIELMRKYPKSYTKTINESEPELNKVRRSDRPDKKYAVSVKNEKGNIVTVHFGDPNMKIKTSDPERRKSFRARHNCDNPGPKTGARWWSCKLWSTDSVDDHV